MHGIILSALLLILLAPLAVQADLYKWQDKIGNWHFTDSLDKVPHDYRDQVKREALPDQPKETLPPIPRKAVVEDSKKKDEQKKESETSNPEAGPKTYKIKYTETKHALKLDVTINKNHSFPFLLDTGATFVSLSKSVGEELGYKRDDILPRIYLSTANGVIACSLVRLDSVQVGDAMVRDVTAIVCGDDEDEAEQDKVEQDKEGKSKEKEIVTKGLLGLSFLNEFDWSNDTMQEELILREFTNKPEDDVYGGQNEKWWRKKFETAKKNITETEDQIKELKAQTILVLYLKMERDKELKIQEANLDFFKQELTIIDRKANRYEVPRLWR